MSDGELLRALSAEARKLASDVAGPLSRVRVRAGGTAVELEWVPQESPRPAAATSRADAAAEEPTESTTDPEVLVRSPMVGTFYHAPAPGEPPFVSVGGIVTPDTVIGIVEAMKLMNRITAETTGVVRDVLVPDGRSVEFEQPLLVLDPPPDQERSHR